MTLTDRELAMVLFALRHAQLLVDDREDLREQGHFTDLEPLDVAEIDDLCDRLNTPEEADQVAAGAGLRPSRRPL
jgi:hypothetical protein